MDLGFPTREGTTSSNKCQTIILDPCTKCNPHGKETYGPEPNTYTCHTLHQLLSLHSSEVRQLY